MKMEPPAILDLDQHHVIAHWKTTLVQFWGSHAHPEAVAEAMRHIAPFGRAGSRVFGLVVITADAHTPDRAVRDQFDRLAQQMLEQSAALAYVYEGDGLRSAALRGLMVQLQLKLQRPAPYKVCRTVEEALQWIGTVAAGDQHGAPADRAAAVQQVRERWESRARAWAAPHGVIPRAAV
jgi:hypothetical protein